jgi:hypothetical protein
VNVDLSHSELKILVRSLQNCIETCKTHQKKPNAPCEDCDGAKEIQGKLQKEIRA